MGLMQSAYETYESLADRYIGDYGQKEVLAPVSHIVTQADIVITLDKEGGFVSAETVDKNAPKIIIPATEKSAGRTSAPEPHPLCELLGYLSGEDPVKLSMYMKQLADWAAKTPHPILHAVLAYMRKGTITEDLTRADLLQFDEQGKLKNRDELVCWRVLGCPIADCWRDKTLFEAFIRYYDSRFASSDKTLCMIQGTMSRAASQYPDRIIALHNKAKLISANDSTGFTYRGRFTTGAEALTISYEVTQKAHAALRWVVANQGVTYGGRTFVCWNPHGVEVPREDQPFLFGEGEAEIEASDYYDRLKHTLAGWKTRLKPEASVILASFDAATTGRLSLTYYNELCASDLLNRLFIWDATCCWWQGTFGVQSPPLVNIVNYAFGSRRNEKKIECDKRVLRQQMQRLIACRVDQAYIPRDIVRGLLDKCHNLHLYEYPLREKLLSTACAVIRKYHIDQKEEWNLALEPVKKDRSYQFGRLLAVLEKAETDTYERSENRTANAIRLQPMYVRQPMHTFVIIMDQLKRAYYPRLHPGTRTRYERLIGEILDTITDCPRDTASDALTDTYLLGYYLQKKDLYTKHDANENKEEQA